MSISSVSSSPINMPSPMLTRSQERAEPAGAPDHDGDSDDGGVAAASAAKPSVNTSGQTVGQMIHVSA